MTIADTVQRNSRVQWTPLNVTTSVIQHIGATSFKKMYLLTGVK